MKSKQKKKPQKSDFFSDCKHSSSYDDFVEREVDGFRVVAMQCQMCDTFGRRPVGFVLKDEGNLPIPDFDTLKEDTETELYYKLNYLSQVFPDRQTRVLIAKTKHELKTRFDALKYDNPKEGTRKHWLENQRMMQETLRKT